MATSDTSDTSATMTTPDSLRATLVDQVAVYREASLARGAPDRDTFLAMLRTALALNSPEHSSLPGCDSIPSDAVGAWVDALQALCRVAQWKKGELVLLSTERRGAAERRIEDARRSAWSNDPNFSRWVVENPAPPSWWQIPSSAPDAEAKRDAARKASEAYADRERAAFQGLTGIDPLQSDRIAALRAHLNFHLGGSFWGVMGQTFNKQGRQGETVAAIVHTLLGKRSKGNEAWSRALGR